MAKRDQRTGDECDARERLLKAALTLFTQRGYAATTVRELVEAAGVTKPVLYYYFGSKEGIYLELLRYHFSNIELMFDYYLKSSGRVRGRMIDLFDRIFTFVLENKDFIRLMHSIYYGPPQVAPFFDFDAFYGKIHGFVTKIIEEGIRNEEFQDRDTSDMAWIIIGVVLLAMEDQISHHHIAEINSKDLQRLLNLIFDGLAATPGRERS